MGYGLGIRPGISPVGSETRNCKQHWNPVNHIVVYALQPWRFQHGFGFQRPTVASARATSAIPATGCSACPSNTYRCPATRDCPTSCPPFNRSVISCPNCSGAS